MNWILSFGFRIALSMLALILPPFFVVLALALLLYLFFRKLPEVERLEREQSGESGGSLLSMSDRMKRLFLGLVERFARLSKLLSLKIHNKLNTLAASAHSARVQVADRIAERKQARSERSKVVPIGSMSGDVSSNVADAQKDSMMNDLGVGGSQASLTDQSNRLRRWLGVDRRSVSRTDLPAEVPKDSSQREAPDFRIPLKEEDLPPLVSEPLQPTLEDQPDRGTKRVSTNIGRALGDTMRRLRPTRERPVLPVREVEPVAPQKKEQLEDILIERISLNPRDIEAYERLGDYYLEQQNLVDAKECYRQVLKLSPAYRLVKIKIRKLERLLEKDRTP